MSEPRQKPGRSKQDYATPLMFLDAARRLLGIDGFQWDFAAGADNSVCPNDCYYSETDDSLTRSWSTNVRGWLWLNPPFADIAPWARKCAEESRKSARIALLVPAAVGSNWFRDHVDGKALVLLLNGRLSFDGKAPYPKDCMLCLYGVAPGYAVWDWRSRQGDEAVRLTGEAPLLARTAP